MYICFVWSIKSVKKIFFTLVTTFPKTGILVWQMELPKKTQRFWLHNCYSMPKNKDFGLTIVTPCPKQGFWLDNCFSMPQIRYFCFTNVTPSPKRFLTFVSLCSLLTQKDFGLTPTSKTEILVERLSLLSTCHPQAVTGCECFRCMVFNPEM